MVKRFTLPVSLACVFALLQTILADDQPAEKVIQQDPVGSAFSVSVVPRTEFLSDDARLNDVCGIGDECWAVGERGVVVRSHDGGQSWQATFVPKDCALTSVCFLTNQIGYVGGRTFDSFRRRFRGVLLKTTDGGSSWKNIACEFDGGRVGEGKLVGAISASKLPPITLIRFFDLENAIAIAASDQMHAGSRVLATADGGATWKVLEGDNARARWKSGAFLTPRDGIVAGDGNASGVVVGSRVITAEQPGYNLREVSGASLNRDGSGWLAGSNGLLLGSLDGGVTWKPSSLHHSLNDVMDYQTVDHVGETVCVAGSPGSVMLHSVDSGKTWTFRKLDGTAPVRRVRFVGPTTVLAVGAFGTIHRSEDSGLSWKAVRNAGYRAGVLSLVSRPSQISYRMLSKVSGDDGFRAVVVQASGRLPRSGIDDSLSADHVLHAVAQAGGNDFSLDWMFSRTRPLQGRTRDELMRAWAQQTDGRVDDLLPQRLARTMRMWRPDVITLETDSVDDQLQRIWMQSVDKAHDLAMAADGKQSLLDKIGLPPWRVSRIVVRHSEDATSRLSFGDDTILPRLKTTSGIIARACRTSASIEEPRVLEDSMAPSARIVQRSDSYREVSSAGAVATPSHLFAGIPAVPGGEQRRRIGDVDGLAEMEAVVRRSRTEKAALFGHLNNGHAPLDLIARLSQVGNGLPAELQLQQLQHLTQLYVSLENFEGEVAVLKQIAGRFPDSPAAADAAEKLFQFYSSEELRLFRYQAEQQEMATDTQSQIIQAAQKIPGVAVASPDDLRPNGNALPAGGVSLSIDATPGHASRLPNSHGRDRGLITSNWDRQAEGFLTQLARLAPDRASSAAVLLRRAANAGRAGRRGERQTFLSQAAESNDFFGLLARAEMQAGHAAVINPVPAVNLPRSDQKPYLDGHMSEACWEDAKEIHLLAGPRTRLPNDADCLVMLAWDNEYIYVSGTVESATGNAMPQDPTRERRHDAKHETRDRVTFAFDIDRDFTTSLHFTIDELGQTSERCWRGRSWNPQWYVAHSADDRVWRFEAAIPLRELGTPINAGDLWAVNIQRTAPGVLHQSLAIDETTVADQDTKGFGLLRFIRRRR